MGIDRAAKAIPIYQGSARRAGCVSQVWNLIIFDFIRSKEG